MEDLKLGFGEILTYASVAIFALGMVTFAVVYRRTLLQTIEEYEKAKNVLQELIVMLRKVKGGKRESKLLKDFDVKTMQSTKIEATGKFEELEKKLVILTNQLKSSSASDRALTTRVMEMQREVQNLTKIQKDFRRRINSFNETIQQTPRSERKETIIQTEDLLLSRITETERWVLRMLVEEGSLTAPKVKKKIGKTREHTARLMKKLWQEGYIERDTHRMPFSYRPTKKLKKLLKKETDEKKNEKIAPTVPKEKTK